MSSALTATLVAGVLASTAAIAQTETVIWNFPDGSNPTASPRLDPANGSLFGTTQGPKDGSVYSLKERREVWKRSAVVTFEGGSGGATPAAGLVEDSAGNLYGTTSRAGSSRDGTVFELSPSGTSWYETVLHEFDGSDGARPEADLILDKTTAAIYGTTSEGGEANCGTAFEMTLSGGKWDERVIYNFQGGADGCNPQTRLREDSKGHLWGVTHSGGTDGYGTAFVLTKNSGGTWQESTPYSFTGGADGGNPTDLDLNPDSKTLYGTAYVGGNSYGVVFQLTYIGGVWSETTLHNFQGGSDGSNPVGIHLDLTSGSDTLYGTTEYGGSGSSGTVFQMVGTKGNFVYSQLHSFGPTDDGAYPLSRPTVDPNTGYLYGATTSGGAYGGGAAYLIIP